MCCFRVADVFLEDPPPEKKKEEEKEKEKVKKNFVLVSDQLNLQPIVSSHPFLHLISLLHSPLFTTTHLINHNILSSSTNLVNPWL